METSIADRFSGTPEGKEADAILRACVHCGFCTATCPTYQLLGDELDGPRGRIYLIKQVLEGKAPTERTQLHLDRCLTCRSCETTCPSGVRYSHLLDIGRQIVDETVSRSLSDRVKRTILRGVLPYPGRLRALLGLGNLFRPLLTRRLQRKLPPLRSTNSSWPAGDKHQRFVLVLEGCAQKAITPETNAATARVLDRLGIRLQREASAGCCGAVSYHNSNPEGGLQAMRRNIDAWWPYLEDGCEGIIVTASGCGAMVKDYGNALKHDPGYAEKANRVASLARDIGEVLAAEDLSSLRVEPATRPIAFHSPCTLQHGQKLPGVVEGILVRLGFTLTPVDDAHLCCGSAGTYSLLQPELSRQLLKNKLGSLTSGGPSLIATANIGCQLHLGSGSDIPVRHWIELIDEAMTG